MTGIAAAALGGAALRAGAQGSPGVPAEGAQYTRLEPPVPPQAPGKLEVIEFFSYACPHCSALEPLLEAWVKKLPADVAFLRIPVPFLANPENFQKTYYALQTLGLADTLQRKVFTAVHGEHQRLEKPDEIAALIGKSGGDAKKFLDAFNSFSVANSVSKAKRIFAAYRIESVPTLAVQGRYLTSPAQAGGQEGALAVADYLLQRARKG
jgi:protein dithiol oxidoreductase (disulfide-forming)